MLTGGSGVGFDERVGYVIESAGRAIVDDNTDRASAELTGFLEVVATEAGGLTRTLVMRSAADVPRLVHRALDRVEEARSATSRRRARFRLGRRERPGTLPLEGIAVQALSELETASYYHGITRGEAQSNPQLSKARGVLLQIFDVLHGELLIPIVLEREVRGLVCLGWKRLRKEYSADDLRLLVLLTEQLALSFENGRLYEESIKAYNKAEATNKKLIEMDRVKKQFVANICHELRTPVSTIIGYSEILLEPDYPGNRQILLERLVHNGQELAQLMDNLLNFARMEADGVFTQFEPVKLKEILKALELMTQRLIRERPIEFYLKIECPIETIESDGQRLQQILVQLLTNAVKFTEKGKIELSVRTLARPGGDLVEIAVADTGIGIGEGDRELIFEEFRQLDGSSTRQYSGTGVGLSICRKLAHALGGTIRVNSELGIGSVFSLLLPVAPLQTKASEVV